MKLTRRSEVAQDQRGNRITYERFGILMLLFAATLFAGCSSNQPPDVQAGPDQTVDAGERVRLRGSASDSDGTVRTYRWEQVDGPPVSIINADQASASFVAPRVKGSQVATFRLTVVDDNNATASDDVVVKVMEYGRLGVTLSGTVKNHSTYKSIPGASITVSQYHGDISRKVGVAKTSRDGRYSVRVRVSPGRLTVSANAKGYADGNTGEIRVTGENTETQVWRHPGGAGSKARIVVETTRPRFPMPEMVEIPAGRFRMGCVSGRSCESNEKPVHSVRIESFEMSKYEVTFEEYDAFTDATGRERAYDQGWGRGRRPIINVSWHDAVAYTQWLSSQTGESYRLPSEAEWEYAARAGSTTKYSWGNDIGRNRANCDGCGSRWDDEKTAPVGSFRANRWGLYDVHGNVGEWVKDCYNDSYRGAPTDGSAWESGDCSRRVLRGGSWSYVPRNLRAAYRVRGTSDYRYGYLGFRVARTLPLRKSLS